MKRRQAGLTAPSTYGEATLRNFGPVSSLDGVVRVTLKFRDEDGWHFLKIALDPEMARDLGGHFVSAGTRLLKAARARE